MWPVVNRESVTVSIDLRSILDLKDLSLEEKENYQHYKYFLSEKSLKKVWLHQLEF